MVPEELQPDLPPALCWFYSEIGSPNGYDQWRLYTL